VRWCKLGLKSECAAKVVRDSVEVVRDAMMAICISNVVVGDNGEVGVRLGEGETRH
jgi:hypothetical protein